MVSHRCYALSPFLIRCLMVGGALGNPNEEREGVGHFLRTRIGWGECPSMWLDLVALSVSENQIR